MKSLSLFMISLIGGTGYVGGYFQKHLKQLDIPFVTYSIRFPVDERDLTHHIIKNKVTKIINCAGYTGKPNVDSCEREENKTECLFANALLPKVVADICSKYYIDMYHISSGCIYNDVECERARPPSRIYTEHDKPNFTYESGYCSWYSGSKALGEQLLDTASLTVFRLRIPFDESISDRNYIQKIVKYPKLLAATNSFSQLDQFTSGIIKFVLNKKPWEKYGIFNVTQPGYLTTFEVVEMMRKHNLIKSKSWFDDVDEFAQYNLAPRSNCVLDSSKALYHGFELTHIQEAMEEAIEKYAYNSKHV